VTYTEKKVINLNNDTRKCENIRQLYKIIIIIIIITKTTTRALALVVSQ